MAEILIHIFAILLFAFMSFGLIKGNKFVRSPEIRNAESLPYPRFIVGYLRYTAPIFIVLFVLMALSNLYQLILLVTGQQLAS